MTRYYKVQSSKLTFGECWRIPAKISGVLVLCMYKIFGIPLRGSEGIPEPTTFAEMITDLSEIPDFVLAQLNEGVGECAAMGFGDRCFYTAKNRLTPGIAAGVYLLHESGEVAATVVYVKRGNKERNVIGFGSLLKDGTLMSTTNRRAEFGELPGVLVERMRDATPRKLWQRHQQRLNEIRPTNPPQKFSAPDAYERFFEASTKRTFAHRVKRGLWVEMTPAEIEAARIRYRLSPPPVPKK